VMKMINAWVVEGAACLGPSAIHCRTAVAGIGCGGDHHTDQLRGAGPLQRPWGCRPMRQGQAFPRKA
jgi:hypothetical protein